MTPHLQPHSSASLPGLSAIPPQPDSRALQLATLLADQPELIFAYARGNAPNGVASSDQVLSATHRAFESTPDQANLLHEAAQVAVAEGQLELAQGLLDRALGVNPANTADLLLAARIALLRSRPEQAEAYLQIALAHGPDSPELHRLLAAALRSLGESARARRATERALELDAGGPTC